MGIYGLKPRFQRVLKVVERPLLRWGVHPDVLTLAALGLSVAGGLAIAATRWTPWTLLLVPAAVFLRTALNALDGMVARDLGVARPWGEVLNETCDRLADVALFGSLAIMPGVDPRLVAAFVITMLLSSGVGVLSKAAGGPRQYGGVMGKADRMALLGVAAVASFAAPGFPVMNIALGLGLAGLVLTLVQRLRKTHVALESVR